MQQHIEIITTVKQIKETATKTGKYLYSFGVPISKMRGEEQLTEWMQVSILQDEQRKDIMAAKKVHFIGQLAVKEAYGNYPQGISIFGFFIEPVLSQVYRQRKVQKNTQPEPQAAPPAAPQVTNQPSGYVDPIAAANPQSEYIPM